MPILSIGIRITIVLKKRWRYTKGQKWSKRKNLKKRCKKKRNYLWSSCSNKTSSNIRNKPLFTILSQIIIIKPYCLSPKQLKTTSFIRLIIRRINSFKDNSSRKRLLNNYKSKTIQLRDSIIMRVRKVIRILYWSAKKALIWTISWNHLVRMSSRRPKRRQLLNK